MERVEYGTDGYPYKLSMSTGIENTEQYPTVEAIPKSEYENRLKADMVAMLTELQLEIEEIPNSYEHKPIGTYDYCLGAEHERKVNLEIIQQKIDELRG